MTKMMASSAESGHVGNFSNFHVLVDHHRIIVLCPFPQLWLKSFITWHLKKLFSLRLFSLGNRIIKLVPKKKLHFRDATVPCAMWNLIKWSYICEWLTRQLCSIFFFRPGRWHRQPPPAAEVHREPEPRARVVPDREGVQGCGGGEGRVRQQGAQGQGQVRIYFVLTQLTLVKKITRLFIFMILLYFYRT